MVSEWTWASKQWPRLFLPPRMPPSKSLFVHNILLVCSLPISWGFLSSNEHKNVPGEMYQNGTESSFRSRCIITRPLLLLTKSILKPPGFYLATPKFWTLVNAVMMIYVYLHALKKMSLKRVVALIKFILKYKCWPYCWIIEKTSPTEEDQEWSSRLCKKGHLDINCPVALLFREDKSRAEADVHCTLDPCLKELNVKGYMILYLLKN